MPGRLNKEWDKYKLKYSLIVEIIKLSQIYLTEKQFGKNWLDLSAILAVRSSSCWLI